MGEIQENEESVFHNNQNGHEMERGKKKKKSVPPELKF